jgi:hypothetical protein
MLFLYTFKSVLEEGSQGFEDKNSPSSSSDTGLASSSSSSSSSWPGLRSAFSHAAGYLISFRLIW